jgi:hypothetical protein
VQKETNLRRKGRGWGRRGVSAKMKCPKTVSSAAEMMESST